MTSANGGRRGDHLAGIRPLEPGDPQRIGPYLLLGRLGAGGMGRVFLARSAGGRTVAVKVVHEEHASNAQFRARFRREIDSARRVGERHTTPVLDADTDADPPWVATGYVPGPSLEQVVRQYGPLPAGSVYALADGLLRALEDIHAAGIVHRDLKPSNVMITVAGPRVIDFGIARALDVSVESLLTSTGMVIGSPGFMSPEQIVGQRVGTATDVFALGCVLMYAASGRLPFGRGVSNQHAVMYQIVQAEPDLGAVEDEPLRALIARCLTKEVGQRPGVAELLEETGRLRPDASDEGWLPPSLVADLAQQAARLLDAEVAPLREEAAEPAGPETSEGAKAPEPAAKTPDRATVDLRSKGAPAAEPEKEPEEPEKEPEEPEERPEKEATPEPAAAEASDRTPRRERRPRRPLVIGIAVVGVVTVGGGAVTLLPHIGSPEAKAPASSRSATPPGSADSAESTSPRPSASHSRSAQKDKAKNADRDKGRDRDTRDTSAPSTGDRSAGGAGSHDGNTDPSGGSGGGGSSDSGGTGSSGGGDKPDPRPTSGGGKVPSSFVGTWKLVAPYTQQPTKVIIYRADIGEHAVRLISDTYLRCEYVARLDSVSRDGSRIDIGTAYVDQARSDTLCTDADPSFFALDEPSGIRHDVGPAHGDGYHYERTG
ncbi:hypothetical protein ACZ90_30145 [Streptomyces albus subsp. albus]|nr:hypothetical protein ACZ90_30145 [Streptomyces albus subsp. albus]